MSRLRKTETRSTWANDSNVSAQVPRLHPSQYTQEAEYTPLLFMHAETWVLAIDRSGMIMGTIS